MRKSEKESLSEKKVREEERKDKGEKERERERERERENEESYIKKRVRTQWQARELHRCSFSLGKLLQSSLVLYRSVRVA